MTTYPKWSSDDPTFHLGINMAGAVSAGAYTAGALDFLMEALEEWQRAKDSGDPNVPQHCVSLDVFSGASAGGMCAAIAAVMVQGQFDHIRNPADPSVKNTTNKFYESWVNKIDIDPLLETNDLASGEVISILDSTVIDKIADFALTPGAPMARPYISPALTLFLTLTNVRGTPFSLRGTEEGSVEEDVAYYGDTLQFEMVRDAETPIFPGAKPLPCGANGGAWPLLKEAAKATGAFPLFLAPRVLPRCTADFMNSPWLPMGASEPCPPDWPLGSSEPISTLNVDGGMTNNDPFQMAHDFLALRNPLVQRNPQTGEWANPGKPDQANCAVLTIAPFPAAAPFDPNFDLDKGRTVYRMLPRLITTLIGQSRFLGESLTSVLQDRSSRFVLAPSDDGPPGQLALQCSLIDAFGGFFERTFRAHDYQLGRRNCQKFLRSHFRLAVSNPIIAAGLEKLNGEGKAAAIRTLDPTGLGTMPIIPLCGTAIPIVPDPDPGLISPTRINDILNQIVHRLRCIAKPFLEQVFGKGLQCTLATDAVDILISTMGKAKLKAHLAAQLKDFTSSDS